VSGKYILDACSVIAYLAKEDGSDIIETLINDAIDSETEVLMHKINFFEVFYDTWRSQGEATAVTVYELFKKLPVKIIDSISDELMTEAARLKNGYHMSVADSFALASAKLNCAALVTSDHHEFGPVEKSEGITFLWIR